jgi:hypothetical protein
MSERDGAVEQHRGAAAALRAELEQIGAESNRRRAHVRTLKASLEAGEAELAALTAERDRTIADLRRIAASRAWRWGHGTTNLLRRLTFRRTHGVGAVDTLLTRLEPPPALPPAPEAAEPAAPQ